MANKKQLHMFQLVRPVVRKLLKKLKVFIVRVLFYGLNVLQTFQQVT